MPLVGTPEAGIEQLLAKYLDLYGDYDISFKKEQFGILRTML
jgi:hypothetical protein